MTEIHSHTKSHYGNSMDVNYMREWGIVVAERVVELITAGKYPILAYRGMSGTTAAISISSHIPGQYADDYARVYVRKKGEKSHGARVEYSNILSDGREVVVIVCDDFISSGTTALEVLMGLNKRLLSSPLDMDSVRFALSLGFPFRDTAHRLNTLEDALSVRASGEKEAKSIRRKYNNAVKKYEAERKAARIASKKLMDECFP